MTDHILSKFPIGPGEILFGVPVKTRRLHSIQTAAKFYGVYAKRLRKALEVEGLVPDPSATDHDVLIDVADVERVVLREKHSLTLLQAQERLNVSEVSMNVLLKAGLTNRHRVTSGKRGDRYFDYEIDQFLDNLSINAQPIKKENGNVMKIRSVARYALRSLSDVIQLILDRKVSWVGRLPEVKGIEALVLRLDEVKAVVRGPTFEGLTAVPAGHFLQITAPVLREIARRGIIKTIRCADPVNRSSRIVFPLAELERFRLDYVSLNHLRDGRQGGWVRRKLAADNIMPAEELAGLEATFYKRSDLKI
ncbi:hypothetical protein ONR75_19010 [Rhodopseudomonas sp. P2A-2r]|uniref:hypothetical protein n=1 Tax=Rhodopseudomonas sp. P2A-2r TaxID=2991972 RepID=UPI002234918C|nr:hypothetical protein [Rhodopseudomonas sp. P2A-2r]UZE47080.1 hypothetical protein ONR75_19010 [Rhodopseudomonas sp. P2A-2r]